MSVYYIDEIMGRGKTTAMINYINNDNTGRRYLFITPYLTEVQRIKDGCESKGFMCPDVQCRKHVDLKEMLSIGLNIVVTHALFLSMDDEDLDIVRKKHYTLIVDEVTCVLNSFNATKYDIELMSKECVEFTDSGLIKWSADDYVGELTKFRNKLSGCETYRYNDNNWIALTRSDLFTSFQDVFIMTYMFEHQIQRCYFDMNGIAYNRLYVNGHDRNTYTISDTCDPVDNIDYSNLIHIEYNDKLNKIGDPRTALSKSWYVRNTYNGGVEQMKNNLYNFFRNLCKTPSCRNLWTVFNKDAQNNIDWPSLLSGKGYAKGFLSCNARGTNEFRDRTTAAYIINRYPNTAQKNFLNKNNINLDSDMFALSEMLQWIWRTAIRDYKGITLYIPSSRMRTLLEQWMSATRSYN